MNISKLKTLLAETKDKQKHYSILIPIIDEEEIVLEVRASKINHAGEICFPGGKVELNETYQEAAIRETCEELVIDTNQVEILGQLPTYIDPNYRHLHLFVGRINNYHDTYSKDEVEEIIKIKINDLLKIQPEIYETYIETHLDDTFPYQYIPGGRNYPFLKKKRMMYFYLIKDKIIWGLTGEILHQFIEIYEKTMH